VLSADSSTSHLL